MRTNFSYLEKFLLKIVFRFEFLNRVLFDIENVFLKKKINLNNKIFITGLPRSGTTILLNTIYSSEIFASITYRNMPFILSPNIWFFFTKFLKKSTSTERAHRDGIKINIDSPEAFEEVFWKIFLKKEYIKDKKLVEHNLKDEVLNEYEKYLELICQGKKKNNYISKNNNNILRINDLSNYFKNSKFIIMYRDPLNHCTSLKKQFFHFEEMHRKDNFFQTYMSFLGHYEFGLNYKSLLLDEIEEDKNNLDYWLKKWSLVYSHLLNFKEKKNIIFLSYEKFCENPEFSLRKILNNNGISKKIKYEKIINNNIEIKHTSDAKELAYKIYYEMMDLSNNG